MFPTLSVYPSSRVMKDRFQRLCSILRELRSYLLVSIGLLVYGTFRVARCCKCCKVTRMKYFPANLITKAILLSQVQKITPAVFGETPNPINQNTNDSAFPLLNLVCPKLLILLNRLCSYPRVLKYNFIRI